MKIKMISLLILCVIPVHMYAWHTLRPDTLNSDKLYRDSTYRRVIKEGTTSLNCYFSYPQGGWQILKGYGNNAHELEKLDKFIRSSFSDTLIYVRRVTLTGYCSIEGSYMANEKLAHERVNGFRNYLNLEYNLAKHYPVEVRYIGEDWDKLRELVDASTLSEREEVLMIIDRVDIFKGREKKLMDLNGGVPYNRMLAEFFPLLRRVGIVVEYDLHRIIEERYRCKLSEVEFQEILARERAAAEAEELRLAELRRLEAEKEQRVGQICQEQECAGKTRQAEERRNLFEPLIAVKTNLYSWAGMTPDFGYTAFTPNLSAEVFFLRRWSAVATAAYADWDYDGDKQFWGVSGYSLEPRFWLNGDGRYRWCYIGAYGQLGDFDNHSTDGKRMEDGTSNCTGTYWEGGLSVGCYLPLNAHWGIEAGVRGGYRSSDVNAYHIEAANYYFNRNFKENRFGVTGVDFSISYRFGSSR